MTDAVKAEFRSILEAEEVDEMAGVDALVAPLLYFSALLGYLITVPVGFHTDYASVPRMPFAYLVCGGRGRRAAVVHDWLYKTQSTDRATADKVLREALAASGYGATICALFYAGVRAGGWVAWNQHAKENAKEVVRQVPQTPEVLSAMNDARAATAA